MSYITKRDKQKDIIEKFLLHLRILIKSEIKTNPEQIRMSEITHKFKKLFNDAVNSFTYKKCQKYEHWEKLSSSDDEALLAKIDTGDFIKCHNCDKIYKLQKNNYKTKICDWICPTSGCIDKIFNSGKYKNFANVKAILNNTDTDELLQNIIDVECDDINDHNSKFFDKYITIPEPTSRIYDIIRNMNNSQNTRIINNLANIDENLYIINCVLAKLTSLDDINNQVFENKTVAIENKEIYDKINEIIKNSNITLQKFINELTNTKNIIIGIKNYSQIRVYPEGLVDFIRNNNIFGFKYSDILRKFETYITSVEYKSQLIENIIQNTKIEQKIIYNRQLCQIITKTVISIIIILTAIFGLFAVIWSIKQ
jgi:hypothetical protein